MAAKKVKKEKKLKLNKIHYVCTGGCKFESNEPGKCHTVGCFRVRNPLTKCDCKDGKHGNWLTYNDPNSKK